MYRVSRTRLVLDALSGSVAARGLVWLLNHGEVFVATALVGNNLANYLVSLSVVMGVIACFGESQTAELIAPLMLTPFIFVFGELLPKTFFYRAPYRLIHLARYPLIAAAYLFSPISSVLALLGRLLGSLTGQTPLRSRLRMSRGELDELIRDGHAAGILETGQRNLASALFEVGTRSAASFGVPPKRLATIDIVGHEITAAEAKRGMYLARRCNHPLVLIQRKNRIIGAAWYSELATADDTVKPRPVIRGKDQDAHLSILLRLLDVGAEAAVLYDERGRVGSVITRRQLLSAMRSEDGVG